MTGCENIIEKPKTAATAPTNSTSMKAVLMAYPAWLENEGSALVDEAIRVAGSVEDGNP
jgi:hypothetical protein